MAIGNPVQPFAALGRAVGRALRLEELSIEQLSAPAARRMRRQQMCGAIEQMQVFVVGNTFFAPVLSFQAWNAGINPLIIGWTATMLVFSWWMFFHWRASSKTDGAVGDMQRFLAETRLNGIIWCMGMMFFYPYVDGSAKTILCCVMVGSLALGTFGFSQAPAAAFWFLGVQAATMTLVPTLNGITSGTASDLMIGFLALAASAAVFNAVLERGREQMRAFLDNEALMQKGEVIDLLLKDYEEQGVEWLWQTDAQGRLISGPQQILALLKLDCATPDGGDLINAIAGSIEPSGKNDLARAKRAFDDKVDFHDVTLPFGDPIRGRSRWIMMRGRPQFDGGEFTGFRGIFADASTMVDAKKQVEFLADHDPLTGAYNRNVVQSRLSALDPKADDTKAYLIDLDGFKQVNDSYGHGVGDELLKVVAARLSEEVDDKDLVARLGGDEFIILRRQDSCNAEPTIALSETLLRRLAEPFLIGPYDISLSASIGTACFPGDTQDGANLLIQADLALYAAKQDGRNKCCEFVESMQLGLQKRFVVTERLKAAVTADEITPYYQPQYCAQSGHLVGFEALARWTDPELGRVGPDIFIPIAEETGLIHRLGEQFLRRACLDALGWRAVQGAEAPVLSVNLSPVQMVRGNAVQLVRKVLEQTGLPAARLEIEITEGVLIQDMQATREILQDLSAMGVRIALDDFGTGYSSLSYIRALPLDRLKIDRAFIVDITDPSARPIVQTIIDLCGTLGLCVVAEGVETEAAVQVLRKMKCDVLQGYYFAPAVSAAEAQALLSGHKTFAAE